MGQRNIISRVVFLLIVSAVLASCASTGICGDGNPATEVRDNLSELQSGQTASAIEAEQLAAELRSGTTIDEDFEQILIDIRNTGKRIGTTDSDTTGTE